MIRTRRRPAVRMTDDIESRLVRQRARDQRARDRRHVRELELEAYAELAELAA